MTDPLTEAVARIIANAMGDNFADAFKNKARWITKRGRSGGRFRDVNEPMQDDYLSAAQAAIAAMREAMEPVNRKKFPILGAPGATIDWQLVHDHGRQAKANHYQTVERLAERGGLSWCELHAILHNRPWQKMEENTAIMECRALEARYLSSILPEIKP